MERGPHQPNDHERTPPYDTSTNAETGRQHAEGTNEPENDEVRAAYERYIAARANRVANLGPLGVNSYGTDDPAEQARIETARHDASHERRRNRARLEKMVELGIDPDDAEAVIEFGQSVRDQSEGDTQEGKSATWNPDEQVGDIYQVEIGPGGIERVRALSPVPRIHVVDVASQRRGIQHGLWVDANQDVDELTNDIAGVLDSSPTAEATEWTIDATEDFGGLTLHGYRDLALVSRLARGVAEHGTAFAVWVQLVGTDNSELLDRFTDFYVGSYDSAEAWARSVADDLGWERQLDRIGDPILRSYLTIDYGRMATDVAARWSVARGIDGKTHIFAR